MHDRIEIAVLSGHYLGSEGRRDHLIAEKNTYPDYSMKIIRQYCYSDYVISEFIMEGTHKGEWMGMIHKD